MTSNTSVPLVLASASPRRRDLLEQIGLVPEVASVAIDERARDGELPEAYVARIAREKLGVFLASRAACEAVLTADTTVAVGDRILGKPEDDEAALAMLSMLVGAEHRVLTAVCLAVDGLPRGEILVRTDVRFSDADESTLRRYVATGEGRDKAGAYAIQGIAGGLVASIAGSYSNVVGLPLAETLALLSSAGVLRAWP